MTGEGSGVRTHVLLLALLLAAPTFATTWTVSPDGPTTSIAAALNEAQAGDVLRVAGGTYPGPLVIDKAVAVIGEGFPVIDGGGAGTVVSIEAPDVTLQGLLIRGSGASLDQENSGIGLEAPRGRLIDNRLEDVLFGIYLRKASDSVVRGNHILGKELAIPRRGDAIRVWYSNDVRIENNRVRLARDVVLWYSERLTVEGNRVSGGRYGLHFMYCDDARIEGNQLIDNSVGAFLMYSRRLRLIHNAIAGNHGPSGYGVGLKDMDDAVVRGNFFAGNRVGAFLDNTPREVRSTSRVEDNLFAANDQGLLLLPNVRRGRFAGNSFVENGQQVGLTGGGDPQANAWHGNFWSDYAGYDAGGDGVGDLPHRLDRLFEDLADRRPELRLFLYSPATQAMDFAARAFPVVKPRPKLVDHAPRMTFAMPPGVAQIDRPTEGGAGLLSLGGGMLVGALALFLVPGRRRGLKRRIDDLATEQATGEPTVAPKARQRNMTENQDAVIEVRNLSKHFGPAKGGPTVGPAKGGPTERYQAALDDVSFTIRPGESVAVWGPNGAGKTTALRAILGVMPYGGTVTVGGADSWRQGKRARNLIGFVPQEITFQADLGVVETFELYAHLRGVAPKGRKRNEDPGRVDEILVLLGLENEAGKKVRELSGGLRQRLALGVALLADPPILLLDEPTANLDARSRADFLDLLVGLKARGKTLVFSSHRPEEVLALADRVLHLENGRLIADELPRSLYLDRHRDAEIWLRVAEEKLTDTRAVLAAQGLSCRHLGPHLVVDLPAADKALPFNALAEAGIRLEDFELHLSGNSGSTRSKGDVDG